MITSNSAPLPQTLLLPPECVCSCAILLTERTHSDRPPSSTGQESKLGFSWTLLGACECAYVCVCVPIVVRRPWWQVRWALLDRRGAEEEDTSQPSPSWRCSPAASGVRKQPPNRATSSWSLPTTRMSCWGARWVGPSGLVNKNLTKKKNFDNPPGLLAERPSDFLQASGGDLMYFTLWCLSLLIVQELMEMLWLLMLIVCCQL